SVAKSSQSPGCCTRTIQPDRARKIERSESPSSKRSGERRGILLPRSFPLRDKTMIRDDGRPVRFTDDELTALRPLQRQHPTLDAALAAIARLTAEGTLPKGTVHVISDVHGEDLKLRHVINNASGTLRPLVEKTFDGRLSPAELQEFITLIFYPRQTLER